MNSLLMICAITIMLAAIVTLIINDKFVDTSTRRMQLLNVWAIVCELIAFDIGSWLLVGIGALGFVIYIVTPRAYEQFQKKHHI